ncbi:MAG: hypothetical protein CBC48_04375 [bacterium TMED88]|nr:hypothetical protein [Deltaproteobacteria bacterium]OUV35226.1 MAG: hypothetical protein CBC48_04375 [bacterium TMED88]
MMNHGNSPSSTRPLADAERDRQRYPYGMGNFDGPRWGRSNDNPNRSRTPGRMGLLILFLGLAMMTHAAETLAAEHAPPPSSATDKRGMRSTAHRPDVENRLDYCTVGRCRPRAAHPWRDTLAFGGLTLAAGSMTRCARRRKS